MTALAEQPIVLIKAVRCLSESAGFHCSHDGKKKHQIFCWGEGESCMSTVLGSSGRACHPLNMLVLREGLVKVAPVGIGGRVGDSTSVVKP